MGEDKIAGKLLMLYKGQEVRNPFAGAGGRTTPPEFLVNTFDCPGGAAVELSYLICDIPPGLYGMLF